MSDRVSPSEANKPHKPQPIPLAQVMYVRGKGFRCAAYRDANGKWRGYFGGEELQGEIEILNSLTSEK